MSGDWLVRPLQGHKAERGVDVVAIPSTNVWMVTIMQASWSIPDGRQDSLQVWGTAGQCIVANINTEDEINV
jgi:hypothetical protein